MSRISDYKETKCQLSLQDEEAKTRRLEAILDEMRFEIECCSRGGNKTADGSCSTAWQEKKIAAMNERSIQMMVVAVVIFAAGLIIVSLASILSIRGGKKNIREDEKPKGSKKVRFQKPQKIDYVPAGRKNGRIVKDPQLELGSSTETVYKVTQPTSKSIKTTPQPIRKMDDGFIPLLKTRAAVENEFV